LLSSLW